MQLYAGIDLHSNNNFLAISDEDDKRHYKKRLPNQGDVILSELEPYRNDLVGIVVESTLTLSGWPVSCVWEYLPRVTFIPRSGGRCGTCSANEGICYGCEPP